MKKNYVKPYIVVESFQLNAAIAAACTTDHKLGLGYSIDDCNFDDNYGHYDPTLGYFGNACRHDVNVAGDGNDEICYHGPIVEANTVAMNS